MRKNIQFTIFLSIFFTYSILSQTLESGKIPQEYQKICDYEDFLKQKVPATSEDLKKAELYFELLGIVNELSDYRQKFLKYGNFIDLFPSAYFHTTAKELVNIAEQKYQHPIEKMKQMIAFYEAYDFNRRKLISGSVGSIEAHWKGHFNNHDFDWKWINEQPLIDPNFDKSGFAINQLQLALNSAIHAHVEADLPRAIRYAYNNRFDLTISDYSTIKPDFDLTDPIFANTQTKTLEDFKSVYSFVLVPISVLDWFGSLLGPDVKSMRQDAWTKASGTMPLTTHPTTLNHTLLQVKGKKICEKKVENTTLFLMDVSGSMSDNNKITQAKNAATQAVGTIKEEAKLSHTTPEIGIMIFSGGCVNDPTSMIQPFSTDLDVVKASVNARVPAPNGGTPLPQAVAQAQKTLEERLATTGQTCGKLVVLGDGQSSCGSIVPPGAFAGVQKEQQIGLCKGTKSASGKNISLFTIGFGIAPGSTAERELQYLANTTNGKYFNAQDQYQLTRSFQKINRIYSPIALPQTRTIDAGLQKAFDAAYQFVTADQQYDTALVLYRRFTATYPTDSAGVYNLALLSEANERYKSAIKYYELYLSLAPNEPNRAFLLERITTLRKDYEIFMGYAKQVIQSDLAYLEEHFQKLQTTPDAVPLAGEFAGFIKEKEPYYRRFAESIESEEMEVKRYAKEVSQALKRAAVYLAKGPKVWDIEGISYIGSAYEPLRRLGKKMGQ